MALSARGLIPAVALAAVGFCVGLLARHTAAAIGVLLGYLFLWFVRNGPLSQLRLGPAADAVDAGGQSLRGRRQRFDVRGGGRRAGL